MYITSKNKHKKGKMCCRKVLCQSVALMLVLATFASGASAARRISLQECVELALENNRDIEQSASDQEIALHNYQGARRAMGPKITWQAESKRIGGKDYENAHRSREMGEPGVPAYIHDNSNSIQLNFPLYTGGAQENRIKATRYGLNAADLTLENTKQTVKYRVAAAYYNLLQRKAMVGVEQEAVNTVNEHLKMVTVGYEEGVIAKSDVLSTKVQLIDKEQALETANGNYLNAMAELNNLIGLPVFEELEVEDELTYNHYDISPDEALEYALKNRPDGIAAGYTAMYAKKSIDAAKAGYQPNIAAVATRNLSGERAFKEDHSGSWSVGLSLNWTPFDNGVTVSQVAAAKAEWEKAKSQAEQTIEKIELDIRKAYVDLTTAEKNIERTRSSVDMAKEDYILVQLRYAEGIDENISVTDAQNKLTNAQTNYVNALYNYQLAKAALDKAMGIPVDLNSAVYAELTDEGKTRGYALKTATIEDSE